jgi:hypothetical protein
MVDKANARGIMVNKSSIFGVEENKYAWTERSQRAGDCWKQVRLPCGMDLGAGSETKRLQMRNLPQCKARPMLSDCSPLQELKVSRDGFVAVRIRVVPRLSRPLRRRLFLFFIN